MKITVNVPDALLRTILKDSVDLTKEGSKKVMSDPRFVRGIQRVVQGYFENAAELDLIDSVHEIVFDKLRIPTKYLNNPCALWSR